MGWPKGKPRKGYVTKAGSPHAKWGESLSPQVSARIEVLRARLRGTGTDIATTLGVPSNAGGIESKPRKNAPSETLVRRAKRFTTQLAHPQYSIEQCPNCEFPEADGGYCPDCGWSQPIVYGVAF